MERRRELLGSNTKYFRGKTNVNPMLMRKTELLPEQGISEQKQKDCLENI